MTVPWKDIFKFNASAAARNHFFQLQQQNKYSESKRKFIKASDHSKIVLQAAKLAYFHKTKKSITSLKLGSWEFW